MHLTLEEYLKVHIQKSLCLQLVGEFQKNIWKTHTFAYLTGYMLEPFVMSQMELIPQWCLPQVTDNTLNQVSIGRLAFGPLKKKKSRPTKSNNASVLAGN